MTTERGISNISRGKAGPGTFLERWGTALRRVALGGLVVLGLLAVSALLAERRHSRDRAEIAAASTFFEGGGRKIRYELKGESQPGPTIVMLGGFVGAIEQWHDAQDALSKIGPVLMYDRGGYGLSDTPAANDANAQADELATLASLKSIKRPLVVVSYSSSSLIARAFAKRHVDLLGGLLFLDPTNPEQILGVSKQDIHARRVLYERTPFMMAAKLFLGIPSGLNGSAAHENATSERAARILSFPSHWWAGYREGTVMEQSAEQANLDWSTLHVPISLLSVASADGSPEVKERYRLYLRFIEASHAQFISPGGFTHDQVRGVTFLPHIAAAVAGIVDKVRAQSPAP